MKRPLCPCVIGLVLGEAVAISFGFKGEILPVLLFLLTAIYFLMWRKKQSRFFVPLLLFSAFLLVGFLLFMTAQENKEPLPEKTLPLSGTVRGRIAFLNVDKEGEYDIILERVQFLSEEEKIGKRMVANQAVWQYMKGKCRVFHLKESTSVLWPGDWIMCEGDLEALPTPTNPGEFNSEVYYQSRGISCQFFANSGWLEARERFSLERISCKVKQRMDAVYAEILGENHAALLDAMLLGDKSSLSEEQKKRYEDNGVAHLLSVSGLHVSILAGSWFRFLRKRRIGYASACAGGLFLLVFYGCMTGFGNSIIRAVIMYAVYLGAEYFGARYDLVSSMSLAGILMLLDSPWRLLEGGCQMSFAAIFSIGCVLPRIKELVKKRKGEKDGRIYFLPRFRRKLSDAFLSSLVISAVTLPIVLRVFFTFSPYSVLINLLVIPCMMPMMVSAIVAGIVGAAGSAVEEMIVLEVVPAIVSVITETLILPAEAVLIFFDYFLEHMRKLPGSVWMPGCPSLLEMAVLYLFESFIFYIWYRRLWRLGLRTTMLFGIWFFLAQTDGRLRITMLDVGQGDSILIQMPGGETVLMDGGSTSRSHVGQYVITTALQYYGIVKLDYVIATHMDEDHISGIEELFETGYPVEYLLLPERKKAGKPAAEGKGQEIESQVNGKEQVEEDMEIFAYKAKNVGTKVEYFQRGDRIQFPENAILRCLHPYAGFESEDKNAASLVFHLEYGEFDVLFTGDLESSGEKELCRFFGEESKYDEKTVWEILKVAHHGSKYSTGPAFLDWVSPKAALISAAKYNRYGHPHKETLKRLEDHGADIIMTAESGAIFVETDGKRWRMDTFCAREKISSP